MAGAAGVEGSRAYVLTAAGQRVYAAADPFYPARRIRAPSTFLLEHAVALADIAIAFRDAAVRARDTDLWWESDWAALRRIGSTGVIPDALVTLERRGWRTRAFIEADRATEREAAFARKHLKYIDHRVSLQTSRAFFATACENIRKYKKVALSADKLGCADLCGSRKRRTTLVTAPSSL